MKSIRVFCSLYGAVALYVGVIGCGAEPASDDSDEVIIIEVECDGHGDLRDGQCDCDEGYVPSEDASTCEPEPAPEERERSRVNADGEFVFVPSVMQASVGVSERGNPLWLMEASDGEAVLSFEIHEAFGGLTSPGELPVGEKEASYARCGTCVILRTECEVMFDGAVECAHTFMPDSKGKIRLTAVGDEAGERLTGSLVGMRFQEVNIAPDFATQPVSGGEQLELADWPFDVQLLPLRVGDEDLECGGHGMLHDGHCNCDPGYRPDPQDPLKCVSM